MSDATTRILVVGSVLAICLVVTEQYWFRQYSYLKVIEVVGLVFPVIRALVAWLRNDPEKDW